MLNKIQMQVNYKVRITLTDVDGVEHTIYSTKHGYEVKHMNTDIVSYPYVVLVGRTEYGLFGERYECLSYKVNKI